MAWGAYRRSAAADSFLAANPFEILHAINSEFSRCLNELPGDGISRYNSEKFPPLSVWSDEEHAVISAALPGIDPAQLDVAVVGKKLSISGRRENTELKPAARYLRQERALGEFCRTVELPFLAQSASVDAQYKDGILTVMVPRAETDKPRKITVRS